MTTAESIPIPASRPLSLIALDDLFAAPSATPGFYAAPGGPAVVERVMDRLAEMLVRERYVSSFRGGPSFGRLVWIESAGLFDPARFGASTARWGLEPERALRTVHVTRCESAASVRTALDAVSRPVLISAGGRRQIRPPLVVLPDLMAPFADGGTPRGAAERAFDGILARVAELRRRAVVIGLQCDRPVAADRRIWSSALLALARRVGRMVPDAASPEFRRKAG